MEEEDDEKANIDTDDSEYYRLNASLLFCRRGKQ